MRWNAAWAALLYAALTIAVTYPFSAELGHSVLSLGTDTDLPVWTLGWDVHAFVHQPFAIFDANIFHPFRHTLAYSENLIGSALLAAPIVWLTGNPVLAMNVIVLFSIAAGAVGAYILGRRVGLSAAGATIAGLVFSFAPPRFLRIDQFHLTTIEWVPFSLAFFHAYFQTGRPRDLRVALAFLTLQALTSGHGGAFLVLGVVLLVAFRVVRGEPLAIGRRVRDVGFAGIALLLPAALIYVPYRAAQVEVGLRRVLDDWGLAASSFIQSPAYVQQFFLAHLPKWSWLTQEPDAWLFPGFLPFVLAGIALWPGGAAGDSGRGSWLAGVRASWRGREYVWFYFFVALVTLWFAVGPPLGVWRWVYWLPGLNFVRVPSRFLLLGVLALGVLAGFGVDRLAGRASASRRTLIATIAGVLLLVEFAVPPVEPQPYRVEAPAIEQWIAAQPGRMTLVDLPVTDSLSVITRERRNTLYMLHSMAHYRPIFEGYSGIQPPGYEAALWQLATFPDEASLDTVARLGFTHVILHADLVPPTERAEVEARFAKYADSVRLEHTEGEGRVYSVHWPR